MLAHHLYTAHPPLTHPCPAAIRHCHAGSRWACGPKDRLATLQGLQQLHADAVLTSWSLPRPHGLPHMQAGEHTVGPSHGHCLGPPPPLGSRWVRDAFCSSSLRTGSRAPLEVTSPTLERGFLRGVKPPELGRGAGLPPAPTPSLHMPHPQSPSPGPVAGGSPAPGGRVAGLWGRGGGCSPAQALRVAVEQLALGTAGAHAPAGEVGAQQRVLLLALQKKGHGWASRWRPRHHVGGPASLPRVPVGGLRSSGQRGPRVLTPTHLKDG